MSTKKRTEKIALYSLFWLIIIIGLLVLFIKL